MAQLFPGCLVPALDSNGDPVSGATWQFYRTGTTTPAAVYADDDLQTALTNPVVADSAGRFPAIYLDPAVTYRADPSWYSFTLDPANPDGATPWVTPEQYGAVGNGTTDDATAINLALATGKEVVLGQKTYAIASTLRLGADGQIFRGQGQGNPSEPARSILKWTGSIGGKMVSVSNGSTEHWQNAQILDMQLNGNSRASIGIEGYDATIAGGCWRNTYRVSITGLTGTSTGINLGSGTFPDFAHDTVLDRCFISGATNGVTGKGSKHTLFKTTFSGCTTAVNALTGSDWHATGCVYSQCGRNVDMGAGAGFADFGGWHEDSTNALVRCNTSMSLVMEGGYYQTQNATNLIDLGNAQGYFKISGQVGPTSASFLVKNVNGNTEYDALGSNVVMESGYRFRSQGVVRADNAAFAAGVTNDQAAATGDGTVYNIAVAFTEEYDTSSAFNASNGNFTAPVDGYYQLTGQVALGSVGAGHTLAILKLVTSNDVYVLDRTNPGATRDSANEALLRGTVTVPMEALDGAYLQITVSGSTKTVDVLSGTTSVDWRTRFEGRLI